LESKPNAVVRGVPKKEIYLVTVEVKKVNRSRRPRVEGPDGL
jgi:hypothetical protein